MSNLNIQVTGFEELKAKIKELSNDKGKKQELLLILRQVAKSTLQAAKTTVPVQRSYSNLISRRSVIGGSLKQSLGFITGKKGNAKDNPTIYVGPRVFKGKKGEESGRNAYGNGWYGHMVHGGHAVYRNNQNRNKALKSGRKKSVLARVTNKRKGNVVNNVPANPFLDKAFEMTKTSATTDSEKRVAKFIQRRINKLSN